MLRTISTILMVVMGTTTLAQTKQEKCAIIADLSMGASDALSGLMGALEEMDFDIAANDLGGEEGESLLILGERRDEMMPTYRAFLDQLEESSLILRRCARG